MRTLLGLTLLATAGCAVQPDERAAFDLTLRRLTAPIAPTASHAPRVGIEHLPEDVAENGPARLLTASTQPAALGSLAPHDPPTTRRSSVVVESIHYDPPSSTRRRGPDEDLFARPWVLTAEQIQEIDNPVERFTLAFVDRFLGEDRRRVQRNLGVQMLHSASRWDLTNHGVETSLDERTREDAVLRLSRQGARLLRRPLRRALRNLLLRDIEAWLGDFKRDHVPLSEEYTERHGGRDWGRVSLRMRLSSLDDPLEVAWKIEGLRIGSNLRRAKISYGRTLADDLRVSVTTDYFYDNDELGMWGDLHYAIDRDTHVHVLVGNRVDILTGTGDPIISSPVLLLTADESPGLLFFVEHMF